MRRRRYETERQKRDSVCEIYFFLRDASFRKPFLHLPLLFPLSFPFVLSRIYERLRDQGGVNSGKKGKSFVLREQGREWEFFVVLWALRKSLSRGAALREATDKMCFRGWFNKWTGRTGSSEGYVGTTWGNTGGDRGKYVKEDTGRYVRRWGEIREM